MVYVFAFSLDQLSSVCPLHNKHSSNPAQSLGQIIVFEPQESRLRQPPPERGLYIGIHLFSNTQECVKYFYSILFYSGCWGGLYLTLTGQCCFLCWVCVCSECLRFRASVLVMANLNVVVHEKLQRS